MQSEIVECWANIQIKATNLERKSSFIQIIIIENPHYFAKKRKKSNFIAHLTEFIERNTKIVL